MPKVALSETDETYRTYFEMEKVKTDSKFSAAPFTLNSEFIERIGTRVNQWCTFCGPTVDSALSNHQRNKNCKGGDEDKDLKEATRLFINGYESRLLYAAFASPLDIEQFVVGNDGWKAMEELVEELKKRHYPMIGEFKRPIGAAVHSSSQVITSNREVQTDRQMIHSTHTQTSVPAQKHITCQTELLITECSTNTEVLESIHTSGLPAIQDETPQMDFSIDSMHFDEPAYNSMNDKQNGPSESEHNVDTRVTMSNNTIDDSLSWQSQDLFTQSVATNSAPPSISNELFNIGFIGSFPSTSPSSLYALSQQIAAILSISLKQGTISVNNDKVDPEGLMPCNYLILSKEDKVYTGGSTIHPYFLKMVDSKELFDTKEDSKYPNYIIGKIKSVKKHTWTEECIREQSYEPYGNLPLQLKLNPANHRLLTEFSKFLEDLKVAASKNTIESYLRHVAKFLLCAMRMRRRLGKELSVDDFVFTCQHIDYFFAKMRENGVNISTQLMFVNSLVKFKEFITTKINHIWMYGHRAHTAKVLHDNLLQESSLLRSMAAKEKKIVKDRLPYAVVIAIIENQTVVDRAELILEKFEQTGMIDNSEYNYLQGYLFHLWVHKNGSRNEPGYKLKMSDWEKAEHFCESVNGVPTEFHLLQFNQPKECRWNEDRTTIPTGQVVLDKNMWTLLNRYFEIRKWILLRNPKSIADGIFVTYCGKNVSDVPFYMKWLLHCLSLDGLPMGSNDIRHSAATIEYKKEMKETLNKASEIAPLGGHSGSTQHGHYLDTCRIESLVGFVKLERIAMQERKQNEEQIKRIVSKIVVRGSPCEVFLDQLIETEELLDNHIGEEERKPETSNKRAHNSDDNTEKSTVKKIRLMDHERNTVENQNNASTINDTWQDAQDPFDFSQPETQFDNPSTSNYVPVVRKQETISNSSKPIDLNDIQSIREVIRQANSSPPEVFFFNPSLQNAKHALDYFARSRARPIQLFTHLAIKGCRAVQGLGLYAKRLIRSGEILFDYRGHMIPLQEHEDAVDNSELTNDEKTLIRSYRMQVSERGQSFMVEGHPLTHKNTVVYGRYSNHSVHKECQNAKGHVQTFTFNGSKIVVLLFKATKDIQAGQQILYSYGTCYSDQEWFKMCPNKVCVFKTEPPTTAADFDEYPLETVPLIVPSEESISISQTNKSGIPYGYEDTSMDALLDLASSLNVSMDKISIGPSTDQNSMEEIVKLTLAAYGTKETIEGINIPENASFPQLLQFLVDINAPSFLFVSNNIRDKKIRCLKFGASNSPIALALHWNHSTGNISSVIATPFVDPLACSMSLEPIIEVNEESHQKLNNALTQNRKKKSLNDLLKYIS